MENILLTSLTTPEVKQLFKESLESFFNENNIDTSSEKKIKTKPFTEPEAAEYLSVSPQTLKRWREKGKIPFIKIGASIRYDLDEVIKALEVSKKKRG